MTKEQIEKLILRLSLAGVFLYFGFSQIFDGVAWVSLVPDWALRIIPIPPAMFVLGNGIFEVVLGTLLAVGIWVWQIALVLAIHLLIIASGFGFSPTGMRDMGLALATLSLALMHWSKKLHL